MSASNFNWVCFACRFVARKPKTLGRVPRCAECGADCFCLGYKVEVPRKTDLRRWKTIRLESRRLYFAEARRDSVCRARNIHSTERDILKLQRLTPKKGQNRTLRILREQLHGLKTFARSRVW